MDPTEDLSARVLLKHILTTEPPRTPVTRRYGSFSGRELRQSYSLAFSALMLAKLSLTTNLWLSHVSLSGFVFSIINRKMTCLQ